MVGVRSMEKNIIHGFTSREEWANAFQTYFEQIKDIDQKNHELMVSNQDREIWIHNFKKQSSHIRKAYLENDEFKKRHIFYFTKHPEHWTKEIADSLISYLYRYWFLAEDVETAYESATSLQAYYEAQNNAIQVMKCKMVLLSCYHFLDEIHFAQDCLKLCKEIKETIHQHYDEFNEEDLSMSLSVYDFQNNIRYDNLKVTDDFEQFFDEVLLPEYEEASLMFHRFMKQADMTLPINASLPKIVRNSDRMFVSIALHIHKDTLREDQIAILCEKSKELMEQPDENEFGNAQDRLGYHMAHRFAFCTSNQELMQLCIDVFQQLPKYNNDSTQIIDVMDAAGCFTFTLRTLLQEDRSSSELCQRVLEDYVYFLLALPYGKVMTYIVDQAVYRNIIPLLQFLEHEDEVFSILLDLTIFRQVQTAIHSQMVGRSATLILSYIIKEQPELLTSIPGLETTALVQAKKREILEFISDASLLHDVGKIVCTNEINMQYRRISDVEFETIKFHPTSSYEILNSIPQLRKYCDIATGHHKSFDGSFGYPAWFDNRHSKQKVFIDLIRICDSLDAATDTFGRLYAAPKKFTTVLAELKLLKGTGYSDVLVDFICDQSELQKELEQLMEQGREDVYREISTMIQKKKQVEVR